MRAIRLLWPASGIALGLVLLRQAGWTTPSLPARDPPGTAARSARGDRASKSSRVLAEGRLVAYPGADVVVAAEVGGLIVRLPVEETARVRAGDLIAELRSDDLRALKAEAEARIAESDADIVYYSRELERTRRLQARSAGSRIEVEANWRSLAVARAHRAAAVATRDHLDARIAKTRITAPISGVVLSRQAHPGEVINAGTPLVRIADLGRVRIEAEVDEFDIARIATGAEVRVTAEGFATEAWPGHVEEVPDAVTARHLRPEDPGRPTDTRVLAVKVALDGPSPLKLGQRVEVEIAVSP